MRLGLLLYSTTKSIRCNWIYAFPPSILQATNELCTWAKVKTEMNEDKSIFMWRLWLSWNNFSCIVWRWIILHYLFHVSIDSSHKITIFEIPKFFREQFAKKIHLTQIDMSNNNDQSTSGRSLSSVECDPKKMTNSKLLNNQSWQTNEFKIFFHNFQLHNWLSLTTWHLSWVVFTNCFVHCRGISESCGNKARNENESDRNSTHNWFMNRFYLSQSRVSQFLVKCEITRKKITLLPFMILLHAATRCRRLSSCLGSKSHLHGIVSVEHLRGDMLDARMIFASESSSPFHSTFLFATRAKIESWIKWWFDTFGIAWKTNKLESEFQN